MHRATWLAQNMKGFDSSALTDPDGTLTTFASAPTANRYAYAPVTSGGQACDNATQQCTAYTLTATLSDGSAYTKVSLG